MKLQQAFLQYIKIERKKKLTQSYFLRHHYSVCQNLNLGNCDGFFKLWNYQNVIIVHKKILLIMSTIKNRIYNFFLLKSIYIDPSYYLNGNKLICKL